MQLDESSPRMFNLQTNEASESTLLKIVDIARELISYPSVTGRELHVMEYVDRLLKRMGWRTERWPIPNDHRFNVFATPTNKPARVVFTTHLDVVPAPESLFTPQVIGHVLKGRGACDAKGIAAVMIQAADSLRLQGCADVGLLFVVEEETESSGAKAAAPELKKRGVLHVVNGEPTEGKLIVAQKGVLAGKISIAGKACHSGYPDLGVDANALLLELGHALRLMSFGEHPIYGHSTVNIGTIKGGAAGNIVSPSAELSFWVRAVTPVAPLQELIDAKVREIAGRFAGSNVTTQIQIASDPIELLALPGFETAVFCGGSDVSYYVESGASCLMYGPGSLLNAHTDDEHIVLNDLAEAFRAYRTIYATLAQS
jgi:acetylornithine deacetylase